MCWYFDRINPFFEMKEFARKWNERSLNVLEERKKHNYIREIGYFTEVENRYSRWYPKTYKKYERAKVYWIRAYDSVEDEFQEWCKEQRYKNIIKKKDKLEELEKEIRIIKEDIKLMVDK